MDQKKQIEKLKELLKEREEQLNKKTKECEGVLVESHKLIRAFQALFSGVAFPQVVQDYADLYELRSSQNKIPKQIKQPGYLG